MVEVNEQQEPILQEEQELNLEAQPTQDDQEALNHDEVG